MLAVLLVFLDRQIVTIVAMLMLASYSSDRLVGQLHIVRTTRNCALPLIMRA
jgi:hypothetical protein